MNKEARRAVQGVAAEHRGLFSASEARYAGIAYTDLVRAELAGEIRRVRRGVYALAGAAPSQWEAILAAALAVGPAAVISHASAATVHRFEYGSQYGSSDGQVELTLPRESESRAPGIIVHRSRDLAPVDVVTKRGVQVTSPARTLVDLAGRLGMTLTEKLLDEGIIGRRWTAQQVEDALLRARRNLPARAELERILGFRLEAPAADSVFEARAYRALEPLKPFEPHYQIRLGNAVYVADAAWPAQMVLAEFVGRAHRVASRSAFDRERRKLTALAVAGWRVAHIVATMTDWEIVEAVLSLLRATNGGIELGQHLGAPGLRRVFEGGRM